MDLPPEICEPLQDMARVMLENNPAPNAEQITRKQIMAVADTFAGQLVYFTQLSARAEQCESVRSDYLAGTPIKDIAKRHGISSRSVQRIVKR